MQGNIHIDTSCIIEKIYDYDKARWVNKEAYNAKTYGYRLVVSQLVLGESVYAIINKSEYPGKPSETREKPKIKEKQKKARDESGRITDELNRLQEMLYMFREFHIDLVQMPVLDINVAEIQMELMGHDRELTANDAGIVAMALNDADSLKLLTLDSHLVDNHAIIECDKRLVEEGRRKHTLQICRPK